MNIKTVFTGKACALAVAMVAVCYLGRQGVENNPDVVDKVMGSVFHSSIDVPSSINKPLTSLSLKYFEFVAGNFNSAALALNIPDTHENRARFEQCQLDHADALEASLYDFRYVYLAIDGVLSCLQRPLLGAN